MIQTSRVRGGSIPPLIPAVLLLLVALSRPSHSFALPAQVTPVATLANVTPPADARDGRPLCLPAAPSVSYLASLRVAIVLADAASAYEASAAYQFFTARGASVSVLCASPPQAVLLSHYYPRLTVACSALAGASLAAYDAVVVLSGYASTAALRIDAAFIAQLRAFAAPVGGASLQPPRALFVTGGAAETLIEAGLLAFVAGPVPETTVSVAWALASVNKSLPVHGGIHYYVVPLGGPPCVNNSGNTASNNGSSSSSGSSSGTAVTGSSDGGEASGSSSSGSATAIGAGGNETCTPTNGTCMAVMVQSTKFFVAALVTSIAQVFALPIRETAPNCSAGAPSVVPIEADAAVFTIVDQAAFASLAVGTNANCTNITALGYIPTRAALEANCTSSGIDFCDGATIGVVVAHGSHDLQTIAIMEDIAAAGAVPLAFCPDDDTDAGSVYLMPLPSRTVTYRLKCDRFYNDSMLAWLYTTVVPTGVIATHGRLRGYALLTAVLDFTGSYALAGSAMALLQTQPHDALLETAGVPSSPFTDTDLTLYGYRVNGANATPPSAYTTVVARTLGSRHAVVLGGYSASSNDVTAGLAALVAGQLSTLVWERADGTATDPAVVGLFLGVGGAFVIAAFVASCAQRFGSPRPRTPSEFAAAVHQGETFGTVDRYE